MYFNMVDYIILAILVVSAVTGFKRGFFASLGKIASTILAIGVSFYYGKDFLAYLNYEYQIVGKVAEYLNQKIPILVLTHDSVLVPLSFIMPFESATELTQHLARLFVEPVAYIILFILTNIILSIVFMFLNRLFSGRFLGGINRTAGMVLLLLKSALIIMIVLGLSMPPLEFAAQLDIMGASEFYSHLYNSYLTNYLMGWFEHFKSIIGIFA